MSSIFDPSNTKSVTNRINDLVGKPIDVPSVGSNPLSAATSSKYDSLADAQDLFFRFIPIDKTNFNKRFPYELWIKDVKTGELVAEFTFPLNPQNITITVPSANVLEATMKGIYETHNGAPFRPISITGTTGTNVIPKAQSGGSSGTDGGDLRRSVEYAFKNTIKAFNSTLSAGQRTINAFSGGTQLFEGPLNYKISEINDLHTGYESIHDLERFLDYYHAAKKLKQNKSWRLYFLNHKDQAYYACSLTSYSIVKSAGTTEYQYSIALNAYRKEPTIPGGAKPSSNLAAGRATTNSLSNIINGIKNARTTIAQAHRVMSGIRSDINETFIAPVGEVVLMGKDLLGLGKSMYDFAFSGETTKAMQESFKQYFTDNKSSLQGVAATIGALGLVGALSANGKPESALNTSAQEKLSSGKAEQFQVAEDSADPLTVIFQNPADHPDVFESFPIDDMNLSAEIIAQTDGIVSDALSMTADDVLARRDKILDFSRSISEALGGGSDTYNRVKGLNPVNKTYKKLTVDDIVLLSNLNDIVVNMERLAAMLDVADTNDRQDYYSFYADYAVSAGLRFSTNNISRFFIPFPVGATLEQLATQYLGAPERWIEIAALNALKSPYVDEDGYEIAISASGGGDTLAVADVQNLYIGQIVEVMSDTVQKSIRKVRSIDVVSTIETLVTFEPSTKVPLTSYRPSDNARIKAFAPNTVNSDMLIAIPSEAQPTFSTTFKTSPEIDELDAIARIAKTDLLLDSSGDMVFTGGGDVRLAFGLTNLIQAALMIINTRTNSLLQNPNFGNPVDAGISVADVTANDILRALSEAFAKDPRFTGIVAGEVQILGGTVNVSLLLGIKNLQVTLPVAAQLPR